MRWLDTLVYAYIGGLMLFYTVAVFDTQVWDFTYFFWAKTCDGGVLAWGAIYYLVKPIYKSFVRPVWIFSIVRAVWEVVSYITGVNVNNSLVVALLFLGILGVTTYMEVIQHRKIKKYL